MTYWMIWLIAFAAVLGLISLVTLLIALLFIMSGRNITIRLGISDKENNNAGTSQTP